MSQNENMIHWDHLDVVTIPAALFSGIVGFIKLQMNTVEVERAKTIIALNDGLDATIRANVQNGSFVVKTADGKPVTNVVSKRGRPVGSKNKNKK